MIARLVASALACAALGGCKSESGPAKGADATLSDKAAAGVELFAIVHTSQGDVSIKLFSKDAPKTVKNFVGLATGEREWKHPAKGAMPKGTPLYDGTIFHRVIPGFMIQGGDPLGSGTGDPGYRFEDEFQSGRTFDRVGLLAMANAGPGTNGSQFFITTSTPGYLNGKHTIFGEVLKGYEIVEAISRVERGPGDRPNTPVTIKHIEIVERLP
ncbi:MAG: peptidylprolyl isomerase [Archangium sp.]|nr:peptidylprolyl isomerase [Archangium sp.]